MDGRFQKFLRWLHKQQETAVFRPRIHYSINPLQARRILMQNAE